MLLESLTGLHEASIEVLRSTILLIDDIDIKGLNLTVGLESPYAWHSGKTKRD